MADEAVLHAVELVDIVDDGQALVLDKVLSKRVRAEGNTEPLLPLCGETLNMEQVEGKVREGRACLHNCVGSVERVRRNTHDQERGLVELQARVLLVLRPVQFSSSFCDTPLLAFWAATE